MKKNVNAVAHRYSKALFEALVARGEDLEQAAKCLQFWQQVWDHPDSQLLRKAFLQPQTQDTHAQKYVDLLVAKAPASTPLLESFLKLLVSRQRMGALSEIAEAFCTRVDTFRGTVRATLVTPHAAQASLQREMEKAIKHAFQAKQLELKQEVDPSLRAGTLVRVGNLVIDATLKRRLKQFQEMIS